MGTSVGIYIYTQGSPSGCVRLEIPGVTQVDEKGHKGNSSSHSLYVYIGGNMEHISDEVAIKRASNSLVNNPR